MGAGFEDKNRQVIPRWRRFAQAVALGETRGADARRRELPLNRGWADLLVEKRAAWDRARDFSHAADLLATAVVSGELGPAEDVIDFILKEGSRAPGGLLDVAQRIRAVAGAPTPEARDAPADAGARGGAVRMLRRALDGYPRNTVLWVDLARAYILCGSERSARRAISVALDLGPANRFVVRSAARMFVHLGEPDRAHDLLRRCARTSHDPWLLSAEIAVAATANLRSHLIRRGRSELDGGGFPPFATSELAGAIGTVEALAGNRRQARRYFRAAMVEPTENVVAQALWVSRATQLIAVDEAALTTPRSFEANAWKAFYDRKWEDALRGARCWFADQQCSPPT
jgi:hypothetical protein